MKNVCIFVHELLRKICSSGLSLKICMYKSLLTCSKLYLLPTNSLPLPNSHEAQQAEQTLPWPRITYMSKSIQFDDYAYIRTVTSSITKYFRFTTAWYNTVFKLKVFFKELVHKILNCELYKEHTNNCANNSLTNQGYSTNLVVYFLEDRRVSANKEIW